jgi:FAD/FMN-containing dehydrogenase
LYLWNYFFVSYASIFDYVNFFGLRKMISSVDQDFIGELRGIVGAKHVVTAAAELEPLLSDWRGRYQGNALCAVYPQSTAEVSAIVQACNRSEVSIVPQGGNTGMCGAATPQGGRQIVLRLDRLNRIRHVSPLDNAMVVGAGCILADLQNAAEEIDRLLPLSLGAEGSCQIGGNIATNAGGTAVLRYGPMRDLVLGLEVVLPNGEVLNDLKRLRKDNTGYALRHLFIGAEGTLGIITAAAIKIFPRPKANAMAMAAMADVDSALRLMALARAELGDRIAAFEVMSESQMALVCEHIPGAARPFNAPHGWYVLIEIDDTLATSNLADQLEGTLGTALEQGIVEDAVVPSSTAQKAALWRLRHSVSEANKIAGVSVSYDSAVPLDEQAAFVAKVSEGISKAFSDARVLFVGHLGDGNIHAIAHFDKDRFSSKEAFEAAADVINRIVDDATVDCDGSISAEHGIGISHRHRLAETIDPVRLALMHRIKALLDPDGLMNPGKVLVPPPAGSTEAPGARRIA